MFGRLRSTMTPDAVYLLETRRTAFYPFKGLRASDPGVRKLPPNQLNMRLKVKREKVGPKMEDSGSAPPRTGGASRPSHAVHQQRRERRRFAKPATHAAQTNERCCDPSDHPPAE